MKLNVMYPLREVLDATSKASETVRDGVERMKRTGTFETTITVYEREGMLTTSQYARVVLTKVNREKTRWEGYMETSWLKGGPRTQVTIVKATYILRASPDYKKIEIEV